VLTPSLDLVRRSTLITLWTLSDFAWKREINQALIKTSRHNIQINYPTSILPSRSYFLLFKVLLLVNVTLSEYDMALQTSSWMLCALLLPALSVKGQILRLGSCEKQNVTVKQNFIIDQVS
jgi:hypothetical protein